MVEAFLNMFKKYKPNNQNNLDNNQNNPTMSDIVRLGHYKAKTGGMSEDSIRMIRVLANDPTNPDMWLLADGTKKTTYDILNNYEFLYTSHEENPKNPPRPLVIGDLGGIPENFGDSTTGSPSPEAVRETRTVPENPSQQPIVQQKVVEKIVEKRIELEQQIIDKCETTTNNKYTLSITIETNLDFEKLKTSINILGLDKNIVAQHVLNKIQLNPNNDIQKMVSEAIVNHILNETNILEIADELHKDSSDFGMTRTQQDEVPFEVQDSDEESEELPTDTITPETDEGNLGTIDEFLQHLEENYTVLGGTDNGN